MNYRIKLKEPELYHYGVKGMKWGVRKEYVPKGRKTLHDKGVGDEIAAEFAAYAMVVSAMLAIHGAKRLSDLKKQGWFSEKYTVADIGKTNTTKDQDLKMVNPVPNVSDQALYDLSHGKNLDDLSPKDQADVNKALKDGWFDNCVYCSTAAALRRRGYDVEAKNSPGRGHSLEQTMKWWKGSKVENFLGESISNPKDAFDFQLNTIKKEHKSTRDATAQIAHMEKTLASQGVGAHGDLRVRGPFGGHSVEYSVETSGVKIYDNQFKAEYKSVDDFFNNHQTFEPHKSLYIRLDNCDPDIDKMLKDHAVKPRGK